MRARLAPGIELVPWEAVAADAADLSEHCGSRFGNTGVKPEVKAAAARAR